MTTITWLRHAQSQRTPDDFTSDLTPVGFRQADQRRIQLGHPEFDMVIHSDRFRTEQTARGVANLASNAPTITVPQLAWRDGDSIGDRLAEAYKELGNANLYTYFTGSTVMRELDAMARMATVAINYHIFGLPPQARPRNVLVVGHSLMISVICDSLGNHFANDQLMKNVPGDCEGYIVKYGDYGDWLDFHLVK